MTDTRPAQALDPKEPLAAPRPEVEKGVSAQPAILLPPTTPDTTPPAIFGNAPAIKERSPHQQSWGALIALVIIVIMVVVGAFYAWGKRIAARGHYPAATATQR